MQYKGFGLGCMGMGLANGQENGAVIQEALREGVTFLNTGDFYGSGESEMVLGEALRGVQRDSYYVSLKFGCLMAPGGGLYGLDVHPARIKNYLTHSLKRLRMDYVDLYQPCRMDEAIPVADIIGTIADLVKEGYVRQIGISEVDAATLERANAVHPIAYAEMEYSLFNRSIEADMLPTARRLGTGLVAFGILAQGNIEKNTELAQALRPIAAKKQATIPQLALAWVLSKGDDIIPLIGASRLASFRDSIQARDLTLTQEDIRRIEAAVSSAGIPGSSMRRMRFRNGEIVR